MCVPSVVPLNVLANRDLMIVSALPKKSHVLKVSVKAASREILNHADVPKLKSAWTILMY